MRRFLVGILAVIGFLVVLSVGAGLGLWYALGPSRPAIEDSTVITLDLSEPLPEAPSTDPFARLLAERELTLREVLEGLERAGNDPRIKGLYARITEDKLGIGKVQELRAAIQAFRAKGKFAIAHADSFGEFGPGTRAYYLASAFDEVWLQPMGLLGLTGLRSEQPFARGTLDDLGIVPRLDHRSEYKTAMNNLTEKAITPAHREELQALID